MESLNSNFGCTDWRKCKNNEDPNVCYSSRYKKTYWNQEIRNNCFPFKKVKRKSKNIKPWVTRGILISIKRKNLLHKSYIKSPNIANKKKFITSRIKSTHHLRPDIERTVNIEIWFSKLKTRISSYFARRNPLVNYFRK